MSIPTQIITFLYGDSSTNTVHLIESRTTRRTVEEVWEDTLAYLHELKGLEPPDAFNNRFNKIHAFLGKLDLLDETKPLRDATPEELEAALART